MASELIFMATEIGDEEFSRAKNKLKSDMFMDLESRLAMFDDMARQTLLWGKRVQGEQHARKVDQLTKDDVLRVAKSMLKDQVPTLVGYGPKESVSAMPTVHLLKQHFENQVQ